MDRRRFLGGLLAGLGVAGLEKFLGAHQKAPVLVKILGTAQDGGIPEIGCFCPNCLRARRDPSQSHLIASLAIIDAEEKVFFLVDASPDVRVQVDSVFSMLEPDKTKIGQALAGILLTHAHIGHYTGLMFFGYESISTNRLPVFCSARMGEFLRTNGPWSQLVTLENIILKTIAHGTELPLTPRISILPLGVPHRDEYSDTLGFVISGEKKRLLYVPDIQSWQAWDRSIEEEVKKADVAILDGTFFDPAELQLRDMTQIGHPPIRESMRVLKNLPPEKKASVYFTHFNHSNLALDPEGEARKEIEREGFRLATLGAEFPL